MRVQNSAFPLCQQSESYLQSALKTLAPVLTHRCGRQEGGASGTGRATERGTRMKLRFRHKDTEIEGEGWLAVAAVFVFALLMFMSALAGLVRLFNG